MVEEFATISQNGEEILGYKADSFRIMTTSTIPTNVVSALGERFFGPGVPVSLHIPLNSSTTDILEEHLYYTRGSIKLIAGKILEYITLPDLVRSQVSYLDGPEVELEWFGVADYRKVKVGG